MSHHHNEEGLTGVVKNYTFTTLLSFTIMFCLFVLLSRCHGDYELHKDSPHAKTEQHH